MSAITTTATIYHVLFSITSTSSFSSTSRSLFLSLLSLPFAPFVHKLIAFYVSFTLYTHIGAYSEDESLPFSCFPTRRMSERLRIFQVGRGEMKRRAGYALLVANGERGCEEGGRKRKGAREGDLYIFHGGV